MLLLLRVLVQQEARNPQPQLPLGFGSSTSTVVLTGQGLARGLVEAWWRWGAGPCHQAQPPEQGHENELPGGNLSLLSQPGVRDLWLLPGGLSQWWCFGNSAGAGSTKEWATMRALAATGTVVGTPCQLGVKCSKEVTAL